MNLQDFTVHIEPTKTSIQWVNTEGWYKVDTPSRLLGDEVKAEYGRSVGTVAYILFEDKRDAVMYKLTMK